MTEEEFMTIWNTPAGNNWDGNAKETHGWWCMQDVREFWPLVEEVSSINPKRILEIGSSHGGTLWFWDKLAKDGQVVSLNFNVEHSVTMDFSSAASELSCLWMNSHASETLEVVKNIFQGEIDFLFIDGDHFYEGVKSDYEMYSPLVRPGGIIAFHDICYDTNIQVGRFFKTIDLPKRTIEFTHGIGIVYK
jgi:predicted O-methyltransferase YrrM